MRFYGSRSSALPPPQGRGPRPRAQRKLAPPLARIVASSFRNRSTLSPHLPACQRIFRDFVSLCVAPRSAVGSARSSPRRQMESGSATQLPNLLTPHTSVSARASVSAVISLPRKSAARNTCKSRGGKHETPGARGACRRGSCRQCWRTPAYTRCTQPLASCMVASVACSMHLAFACDRRGGRARSQSRERVITCRSPEPRG